MQEVLDRILSRLPKTPAEAERVAEAGKLLAEYLRLAERIEKLAREEERDQPRRSEDFRGLSLHKAAHRILADAGHPLHVKDLGARIKARGWRHRSMTTAADQIYHQLAARLPRHPEFQRVGPNTFALTEWGGRPPRKRPRPRLPLFDGPGNLSELSIDSDEPITAHPWHSS